MKEHFNSVKPIYNSQHNPAVFSPRFSNRQLEKSPISNKFEFSTDDLYNNRINRPDDFEDEFIAGMDLASALESIDAIKNMSGNPKGSSLLSQAHNPVDTDEILKIFSNS